METDHLCIGGGPAGVFAALTAAANGKRCMILEHNKQLGRKLRITGKGRCNLTNNCDRDTLLANIPANGKFLYSALSRYTPQDVMAYFEGLGVPLKTERGNRVFPVSDRAEDIVQALQKAVQRAGIPVVHGNAAHLILEQGRCLGVRTADGREFRAGTTLLATGGLSYPKTGSDGTGYRLAEEAGHTIVPPMPSLIPLVTKENWCRDAMGLSLRNVTLRLYRGEKCVFEDLGEMLFTHFGVSGPLVLSASALMRKGSPEDYRLEIDLKPGLTPEQLDKRIQRDLAESPNRDLGNILHALLPAKLILPVLRLCGIAPDTKANTLTKAQRLTLGSCIKAVSLHVRAFRPIEEAIITRGGVSVKEVDARTMASKRCEGLYFAGEILDLDGYTGGFNLQIAFSTAYSAGIAMADNF
ncbi:NAD(P)/FAD-dependent oxidoreductase [uncultured Ruminococcus sp.]|uniref:NAD(P)/FAD-dependent oxidoreductase n=1 Tax=uncultured Ruminococcus sp. TaxID=165186 RepID=UPI00265DDC4A|nr:NAD(P)/FAD-dependent oxidoreductase [uncultured Ruminococcus sp.]